MGTLAAHQDIDVQVAALTEKIAAQPHDPVLYHQRADLHRAHEELALALADYDRALDLAPDLTASHIGRASTLLATGNAQQALKSADRAASLQPGSADAQRARARVLTALGRPDDADKAYIKSITLRSRPSPELYIEHATAMKNQVPPNFPRAIEILTAGINTLGPLVTLVSPTIDLHLEADTPELALSTCDQLPPSLANTPNWLVRRAGILATLGRTTMARQTYRTAQQAIARLPERRRKTAAMTKLLTEIQNSINALKKPPSPTE